MKPRMGRPKAGHEPDTKWHSEFVAEFIKFGGNMSKAAAASGISRQTLLDHRKKFKSFANAIKAADEQLTDNLETAMLARATNGLKKPVYQGGALVGHIQEYPEAMAMFMLKNRRKRYRKSDSVDREGKSSETQNVNVKVSVRDEDGRK